MLVPVPVSEAEPSDVDGLRAGDRDRAPAFAPSSPDGFQTPMSTLSSSTANPATNTAPGARASGRARDGRRRGGGGRNYVLKAIGPCMPAARQVGRRDRPDLPTYPPSCPPLAACV